MTRYKLVPGVAHIECVHCGLPWTFVWERPFATMWRLIECGTCKAVVTLLDWHPEGPRLLEMQ